MPNALSPVFFWSVTPDPCLRDPVTAKLTERSRIPLDTQHPPLDTLSMTAESQTSPGFFGRHPWLSTSLLLLTCFLLINRALVLRKATPVWDADTQAMPWQILVADHARAGQLLLWNPWTNGGSPDFAEPQVGAFSPVTVFVGMLTGGSSGGFIAYWLLVWCLGGIGMLCLARHLGSPPWGGFVAALGFLFSGFFTGHAEHMSHLHTMAWLPFVVWRLDAALTTRKLFPAFQAGAIWGLSALAGYPGLVLIGAGFCFLWVLGRMVTSGERKLSWRFATLCLVILGVTGLFILSPTYAGFLKEARGYTERAGTLSPEMAATNALHPGALLSFASPYMNSLHLFNVDRLWPYTDVSSSSIYVSPLVLCLALCGAMAARRPWRFWLLGIAAAAILFSLARVLPFHGWLYALLPPFRFIRHPAIFRDFAILCMVILSIPAFRDLDRAIRREPSSMSRSLLSLSILLGALAIAALLVTVSRVANPGDQPNLARVHCIVAWSATPVIAILVRNRRRLKLRPRMLIALIIAFAICDASFALGLTSHTVYNRDPAAVKEWQEIDAGHAADLDLTSNGLARKAWPLAGAEMDNKNLPVKLPVFRSYSALKNPYHEQWARNLRAASLVSGPDRTWFSKEAVTMPPDAALFRAFLPRAVDTKALPMLVHEPTAILDGTPPAELDASVTATIASIPLAFRIPVKVLTYEPRNLEMEVACPSDGWILVTDRWARGWSAQVNGRQAKLWCAAFIFRALEVKQGVNVIRFDYRPWGYPWLLIVSWGILAAIGLVSLKQRH